MLNTDESVIVVKAKKKKIHQLNIKPKMAVCLRAWRAGMQCSPMRLEMRQANKKYFLKPSPAQPRRVAAGAASFFRGGHAPSPFLTKRESKCVPNPLLQLQTPCSDSATPSPPAAASASMAAANPLFPGVSTSNVSFPSPAPSLSVPTAS